MKIERESFLFQIYFTNNRAQLLRQCQWYAVGAGNGPKGGKWPTNGNSARDNTLNNSTSASFVTRERQGLLLPFQQGPLSYQLFANYAKVPLLNPKLPFLHDYSFPLILTVRWYPWRYLQSSSNHTHPFQVSFPNPRTLSHKSSFIPRTCNSWNALPSSFPESYNMSSSKSNIHKLDLISLPW